MKINIIYWSGGGNTEMMANLIKEGATEAGAELTIKNVADVSIDDIDCDLLALGCSSMNDEKLEEFEFEPFIESIEDKVSGKKLALFGSCGWGDGQWMRDWDERMKNAGAILVTESLIVNERPEGASAEKCKAFGRRIAG